MTGLLDDMTAEDIAYMPSESPFTLSPIRSCRQGVNVGCIVSDVGWKLTECWSPESETKSS